MRKALTRLALLLLVAAASGVGGWMVAQRTAPADQTGTDVTFGRYVTAPVEVRDMTAQTVTRGTVVGAAGVAVAAAEVYDTGGLRPVITYVVQAGTVIETGDVVYEVSGQPVFALAGELPALQDFRFGAEGPDVMQLQSALEDLGYYQDEIDGKVGSRLLEALERFYDDRGYVLPGGRRLRERYAPESSFVFLEELPIQVLEVFARRGDQVPPTVVTVGDPSRTLQVSIDAATWEVLRGREQVEVRLEGINEPLFLSFRDVETDDLATTLVEFDLPDDTPLQVGANVRVGIVTVRSPGPVTAVPLAALHDGAGGRMTVRVLRAPGDVETVAVEVGIVADGMAEVWADGRLEEGDPVVVAEVP